MGRLRIAFIFAKRYEFRYRLYRSNLAATCYTARTCLIALLSFFFVQQQMVRSLPVTNISSPYYLIHVHLMCIVSVPHVRLMVEPKISHQMLPPQPNINRTRATVIAVLLLFLPVDGQFQKFMMFDKTI